MKCYLLVGKSSIKSLFSIFIKNELAVENHQIMNFKCQYFVIEQ